MSSAGDAPPTVLRDHWWWRPGWSVGRSFYTWHITFADQPPMYELANYYAPMLAALPMFDPVPIQWLHLTMQGVCFTDEVDPVDLEQVVHGAQRRLAELQPFRVTIGPPRLDPEGLPLPVWPVEPLREVRGRLREAIAEVRGPDRVPEAAEAWWPHVTLAYANADAPVEPVAEALANHPQRRAELDISAVSLIQLNRDRKVYQWVEITKVGLSGRGS